LYGIENVRRIIQYGLGLLFWLPGKLIAQRVMYSESLNARSSEYFRVIGKSVNFYWEEKQIKSNYRRGTNEGSYQQSFRLLDAKLHLIKEIAAYRMPGVIKQWLVSGSRGLDQILMVRNGNKTTIIDHHFPLDESRETESRILDSLPFSANPSRFILVRSEDQSKILLIAFENVDTDFSRLHALLFNADWSPVYRQVISHESFSQPFIQDEEIGFASESFDNLPVKLANNGEWVMVSSSCISRNFTLFHADANGIDYVVREIPLSPYYKMEDVAMTIIRNQEQISVGFLSAYQNGDLKSVQVCNYAMKQERFDFDSSYHFSTRFRMAAKKNLSHESFISIPGGGYMLLKEYGSPFEFENKPAPLINNWETAYLLANYAEADDEKKSLKEVYRTHRGLSPIPLIKNRGDLNIFYFPAVSKDSTWSGSLDMEQHAESNNPDLSYLLIPKGNKLYMIYNTLEEGTDPLASTTTLNLHGQTVNDPLIFWQMKRMLNFQRSRRFSADEVAVPYADRNGFAVIHLY
jgi:hypothetical protein